MRYELERIYFVRFKHRGIKPTGGIKPKLLACFQDLTASYQNQFY